MKEKWIFILIGSVIAGAILYPLKKKMEADAKKQEEECMKMVDEFVKKAKDEERKHNEEMERIIKEGEQKREEIKQKFEQEMIDIAAIAENYNKENPDAQIHCMMKYKDANGEIHEFDASDPKQFREVMKVKTNTLIFG